MLAGHTSCVGTCSLLIYRLEYIFSPQQLHLFSGLIIIVTGRMLKVADIERNIYIYYTYVRYVSINTRIGY